MVFSRAERYPPENRRCFMISFGRILEREPDFRFGLGDRWPEDTRLSLSTIAVTLVLSGWPKSQTLRRGEGRFGVVPVRNSVLTSSALDDFLGFGGGDGGEGSGFSSRHDDPLSRHFRGGTDGEGTERLLDARGCRGGDDGEDNGGSGAERVGEGPSSPGGLV